MFSRRSPVPPDAEIIVRLDSNLSEEKPLNFPRRSIQGPVYPPNPPKTTLIRSPVQAITTRDGPVYDQGEVCLCNRRRCVE